MPNEAAERGGLGQAVKAFISYSWSTPAHEAWVLQLASRLMQDGVEIILDKWDLKPGHDAHAFMEKMVTDPSVNKVLMICDRIYAEKADGRRGGVGAESQIMSPALYGKTSQDKFAAAITELKDGGEPWIPTFYKGRIYFDFSRDDNYEASYEELLRWLVGKPQHIKPDLGQVPPHIAGPTSGTLPTQSRYRRAEEAVRGGTPAAAGLIREFGEALAAEFEVRRIKKDERPFDDHVVQEIVSARPFVTQLIGIVTAVARYGADSRTIDELGHVFESVGRLMYRPSHITSWSEWDFDAYRFTSNEIFLASIAVLLRERRYDIARSILERGYLLNDSEGGSRGRLSDFTDFSHHLRSLEARKQRLNSNRISLHADMLQEAYNHRSPNFDEIMQADFLLYMRSCVAADRSNSYPGWYPVTMVFAARRFSPFEIFARAESRRVSAEVMPLLGVNSVDDFRAFFASYFAKPNARPRFDYFPLELEVLTNLEHLGTRD